mgnify:CR=1 FL=1
MKIPYDAIFSDIMMTYSHSNNFDVLLGSGDTFT